MHDLPRSHSLSWTSSLFQLRKTSPEFHRSTAPANYKGCADQAVYYLGPAPDQAASPDAASFGFYRALRSQIIALLLFRFLSDFGFLFFRARLNWLSLFPCTIVSVNGRAREALKKLGREVCLGTFRRQVRDWHHLLPLVRACEPCW